MKTINFRPTAATPLGWQTIGHVDVDTGAIRIADARLGKGIVVASGHGDGTYPIEALVSLDLSGDRYVEQVRVLFALTRVVGTI